MAWPTALVAHPACALHDTGWNHPEHQGRLPAVVRGIYRQTPDLLDRMLQVEAPAVDEAALLRVHTAEHVAAIRDAVGRAESAGGPIDLTPDTRVSPASWEASLGAAGAAVEGIRLVVDGEAASAFALTRPPGHHATPERAMGFCLFNNVAVAARWAQAERGIERVLIVDWDVHHGNGTQDVFVADGSVFYLSLHLRGHYPGTGRAEETGRGEGAGTTRNLPFPHGADRASYLRAFEDTVREVAGSFRPQLILVSAGFDCLAGDPLGGLLLEPADLHHMTTVLMESGSRAGAVPLAMVLEGGYAPARMADGVVEVIRALAGLPPRSAD
jgi:acetoin utilization deacetylase AcuC-like enzyme